MFFMCSTLSVQSAVERLHFLPIEKTSRERTHKKKISCKNQNFSQNHEFLDIFSKNSEMSQDEALLYGTSIFVITILTGVLTIHYLNVCPYYGLRIRVAVCSLIYRKVGHVFVKHF